MADEEDWFSEAPAPQKRKLVDQIYDKYETSRFDPEEKHFLPEGCLDELLTLEVVIKELLDKDDLRPEELRLPEKKKDVVDFILSKAPKVFATAVVSGLRGKLLAVAMVKFHSIGFHDECLPVTEHDSKHLKMFQDLWSNMTIRYFRQEQWRFLAPVFSRTNCKLDLKPGHILPFIKKYDNNVKEGAFGRVYRVEIHPAHQKDPVLDVRTC